MQATSPPPPPPPPPPPQHVLNEMRQQLALATSKCGSLLQQLDIVKDRVRKSSSANSLDIVEPDGKTDIKEISNQQNHDSKTSFNPENSTQDKKELNASDNQSTNQISKQESNSVSKKKYSNNPIDKKINKLFSLSSQTEPKPQSQSSDTTEARSCKSKQDIIDIFFRRLESLENADERSTSVYSATSRAFDNLDTFSDEDEDGIGEILSSIIPKKNVLTENKPTKFFSNETISKCKHLNNNMSSSDINNIDNKVKTDKDKGSKNNNNLKKKASSIKVDKKKMKSKKGKTVNKNNKNFSPYQLAFLKVVNKQNKHNVKNKSTAKINPKGPVNISRKIPPKSEKSSNNFFHLMKEIINSREIKEENRPLKESKSLRKPPEFGKNIQFYKTQKTDQSRFREIVKKSKSSITTLNIKKVVRKEINNEIKQQKKLKKPEETKKTLKQGPNDDDDDDDDDDVDDDRKSVEKEQIEKKKIIQFTDPPTHKMDQNKNVLVSLVEQTETSPKAQSQIKDQTKMEEKISVQIKGKVLNGTFIKNECQTNKVNQVQIKNESQTNNKLGQNVSQHKTGMNNLNQSKNNHIPTKAEITQNKINQPPAKAEAVQTKINQVYKNETLQNKSNHPPVKGEIIQNKVGQILNKNETVQNKNNHAPAKTELIQNKVGHVTNKNELLQNKNNHTNTKTEIAQNKVGQVLKNETLQNKSNHVPTKAEIHKNKVGQVSNKNETLQNKISQQQTKAEILQNKINQNLMKNETNQTRNNAATKSHVPMSNNMKKLSPEIVKDSKVVLNEKIPAKSNALAKNEVGKKIGIFEQKIPNNSLSKSTVGKPLKKQEPQIIKEFNKTKLSLLNVNNETNNIHTKLNKSVDEGLLSKDHPKTAVNTFPSKFILNGSNIPYSRTNIPIYGDISVDSSHHSSRNRSEKDIFHPAVKFNSIPFIVGQSTAKSYHIGLNIQQTLSLFKLTPVSANPKDINDKSIVSEKSLFSIFSSASTPINTFNSFKHDDCPCIHDDAEDEDREDPWAVPQKDYWDNRHGRTFPQCTCLPKRLMSFHEVLNQLFQTENRYYGKYNSYSPYSFQSQNEEDVENYQDVMNNQKNTIPYKQNNKVRSTKLLRRVQQMQKKMVKSHITLTNI